MQQLLAKDLKPLDIVTRKSLENALRLIAVLEDPPMQYFILLPSQRRQISH